jgi:AraC-like DNA-binding protein
MPVPRATLPAPPISGQRFHGPLPGHGLQHFHAYDQPLSDFAAFTHVNEAICTADHRLREHQHPAWEICYFIGGRAEWSAGGERFAIGPGDVFITRPGEIHGGRPDPRDPNHNCAVGFDPACLGLGLSADLGAAVSEAKHCDDTFGLFGLHVIHTGPGPEVLMRRILSELDALTDDARHRPLCLAMIQALLVELFVLVTRASLSATPPPTPRRRDLRELLSWIGQRLEEPPSLDAMADRIGLSPAHLVEVFRRELGSTPLEHLTELRIAEACRRLADPRATVTDVALDLGFCSSQYFSAVFRRRRGCTPTAWRRR